MANRSNGAGLRALTLAAFLCLRPLPAPGKPQNARGDARDADRAFQSALAHFDARRYAEALQELQPLAQRLPQSFDVNELLGLVYAAEHEDAQATIYLAHAARLRPDSGAAHSNLAANLARRRKNTQAEVEFKKAVQLEPASYDANHNLGEFYIHTHRLAEAIPYLVRAQSLKASYDNGYDLALAQIETGRYREAQRTLGELLQHQDAAELHNLLAEADEKSGDYVGAENEYERAAHLEPSEENLFDWGSELLLHQTLEPAEAVFRQGIARFPRSARMQLGLGITLYARGQYDAAVKALSLATDLAPHDPRPYLFLAKAYDVAPTLADEVQARLKRFAQLDPQNARAQYNYAMSLWKSHRERNQPSGLGQVESRLKTAIALDPKFADACLQLGILYAAEHRYSEAVDQYERAIRLNPDLGDAHYRLAQALARLGERARAQREFALYDKLHQRQMAEADRHRSEIMQFVYVMKQPQP